ncbi:MAG TPA: riboflavin biosynthesis protein RibF [Candidatus Margulisiibacteriota bacterium]|nr:riboflavin biosynthesis protein RibF [Candidatus Margulisiibacteriota bacterium]
MKVIYGINKLGKLRNPVVAMGVFDGVHRGHRLVLKAAVAKAKEIKGTSVVLTFWPHPQKEESIYSFKHRLSLFSGLGIDACVVINFNRSFERISAKDFIEKILLPRIRPAYLYVGKNFRFGKGAKGNLGTLRKYGLKVKAFEVVKTSKKIISSTYIRRLIKNGNLYLAQKLLSRRVSVLGTVTRGESIGRKIGFPTANIDLHHEVTPAKGIYAVRVILKGRRLKGACYIGTRPTFSGGMKKRVEVHILGFKKMIYGKDLEIQFIKKIREDRKFNSAAGLSKQIKKDILLIRSILSHT